VVERGRQDDMKVLRTVSELKVWRKELGLGDSSELGCVPTMGFLHEGHQSLIKESVRTCEVTLVTIFVNPAQFAAGEDWDAYPRDEARDLEICRASGVDCVFAPDSVTELYPPGFGTWVTVSSGNAETNSRSEGASRPTFFRGVATVLTKLFILTRPGRVFFGQKDAQQCVVVRQLVRDLDLEILVDVIPTVRERDGLAKSSRNSYLTPAQRAEAPSLYLSLCAAQDAWANNRERSATVLRGVMEETLRRHSQSIELRYVSVADPTTMQEFEDRIAENQPVLLSIAAMLGRTRLIDNLVLGNEK